MSIAIATYEVAPAVFRRYLAMALSIGLALMAVPIALGLPAEPFILMVVFLPMLGGAVLTVVRSGGSPRQLFWGILRWRFGWGNWLFVTLAIPSATVVVAVLTGTYAPPTAEWAATAGAYLFSTLVLGTLVLNLWEEVAWQGMIQRHLTGQLGPAKGVLLTAIPFALLHVPLVFAADASIPEALVATGLLFVVAPPFRYLLGRADQATGGSLLAVAILHASFNASGSLDVATGGWEHIVAVVVIAAFVLITRRRVERSGTSFARTSPQSAQGALGESTHVPDGPQVGSWGLDELFEAGAGRHVDE